MAPFPPLRSAVMSAACCAALGASWPLDSAAQSAPPAPALSGTPGAAASGAGSSPTAEAAPASAVLQTVTVTAPSAPRASVAGWGDLPLAKTPLQASVTTAEQVRDGGFQRLADLTRLDPAVSDAYNAEGYYDNLTIRGYVLDNRFSFRRDGLPINAESAIPLENKSTVEILKGTSGLQAGTSAPGGLVNFVVKRPTDAPLRSAFLEWRQPGTVTGAVDLSQRFGQDNAFGVRLNAAAAHLDPMVRESRGNRQMLALAADWRLAPGSLLEAEIETSHRSQPSQPGSSLLGTRVPPPDDPRVNLNDQPWSLPVVFHATTASLRWQQALGPDWRFVAHVATQRLRTDDRLAYPFGCSKENNYDRYCADGSFDFYDFQSDDERRTTDALQLTVDGKLATGSLIHRLSFGVLPSRFTSRLQPRVDDGTIVGTGTIDGQTIIPTLPALGTAPNTNRDEHSTELSVRDAVALTDRLSLWLGVRHTRLHRASVRTDGSLPSDYTGSFNAPFAAVSQEVVADQFVYASWSRGVESNVVANRSRYVNAGETFTSMSRQIEIGWKGAAGNASWSIAGFDIQRPRLQDFGSCDDPGSCTTRLDGHDHHRGLEASGTWQAGHWQFGGGAQWLHARVDGSADPQVDGREPPNVPARTLKLQAAYDFGRGLSGALAGVTESRRLVLPDNSISVGGYARFDGNLRWSTRLAGTALTWRAGVDNLLDRRAWRESPYQFGHAYLYPLLPRTWRLSAQVDL